MNIKLNSKVIKEMCGTVSFKRGESFFRSNKVRFEEYNSDQCNAIVNGVEDFYVTIQRDSLGAIHTECSCPRLASFDQDCQHIAAVLISIYEHNQRGVNPIVGASMDQKLATEVLNLFHEQSPRTSGQTLHFDNRKVISVIFTCKPVDHLIGIEMKVGPYIVKKIRVFLEKIKKGIPYKFSSSFTFDPKDHCFLTETNEVIEELIHKVHDELAYSPLANPASSQLLPLPPTSWERIFPLLQSLPNVKLEYMGKTFDQLQAAGNKLPLQFDFLETGKHDFQLKIHHLNQLMVLAPYSSALFEGRLYQLEAQDCVRLSELKQMLDESNTDQLVISNEQISFFMEKVVPGLKRLGKVTLSKQLNERFRRMPLKAKLYLDRLKNRLLAGLEFHYENQIFDPFDKNEASLVIRDVEKENEILKLIEESSFTKTEGGYFLHNEELEYEFLQHVVPKLQKLVQIYATTAVRNRLSKENVKPQIRIKVKKERMNWLEFTFEMKGIANKEIWEVLQALEEKRKYYRLPNGSLLSLETKEFEEIHRFLHMPHVQNKDFTNGLALPIEQCLELLDSVQVSDVFKLEKSFREFLKNLENPGYLDFEIPKRLEPILREYQKTGYKWMKTLAHYHFGGILADDMGLGKTIQSIAFILSVLPEVRKNQFPVLIVCPSSLTYNWLSEIMRFAPELQVIVMDGNQKERIKLQREHMNSDVVITSYPLLRRDIKWFEKQSFHTIFFDEAQSFKNPLTQTARAVKRIAAHHRFALTGTPMENSLEELWSIFNIVFPELFQGLKEFSMLPKEKIARRIRPFLLRRLKEHVLAELPEKVETMEMEDLLPEQKKLYAAYLAKLRHDTLKHLDKDTIRKNRIRILAGLTRLRQICCHPKLFVDGYKGSSAKFNQLMQLIEESKLAERRVLIFSQFTKMLEMIGRELTSQNLRYFYLDGQTPSEKRVEICNQFNAGERDFFLISLKAGGTGLNLMGADTVILFDTWWNPAVEEQAADRAHRMGQKKVVQVIKLVARGTIEEKMNELQEKKKNLIEEVIDPDKKMVMALTEEDLREILMF